jgi:hypothetical protein
MPTHNPSLFEQLLSSSISRYHYKSISEWHQHFLNITEKPPSTLEQAALGGRYCTNMSYAFSAGYQSAIQSLFKPNTRSLSSVCITEKEGNQPKNINSTLTKHKQSWQLNGSKSFITGANDAKQLYIAVADKPGSEKHPNESTKKETTERTVSIKPKIKMLSVPADQAGVNIVQMPSFPFVPDVSHGIANFEHVNIQATQILAGDGYSQYIKPFRTHEDIHVLAAIIGFRIGEAIDSNWSKSSIEAHLMLLSSLLSLNPENFAEATTHILFSGCRTQFNALVQQTDDEFKQNNPEGFSSWKRDKALLDIASKAHKVRTLRAWDYISSASSENRTLN